VIAVCSSSKSGGATVSEFAGGRTWWAHFEFSRMNIGPIMVCNQIEDLMEILESVDLLGRFDLVTSRVMVRDVSARR
jgi:hypothetical protein